MATAVGTATLNFGAAPGTQNTSVVVSGQTGFTAVSHAEAFLMGDATATHNADEHLMVPLNLVCGDAGTGTFTIYASSEFILTGTFTCHWVWST